MAIPGRVLSKTRREELGDKVFIAGEIELWCGNGKCLEMDLGGCGNGG